MGLSIYQKKDILVVISCFESFCGWNPGSAAVNGSFGIDFNRPEFHPVFLG